MNAAALAAALGKAQRQGREWCCLCPAHDDHNPSLAVRDGKNGKLLIKCRAGCDQIAVIDALKARGLWEDPKSQPPNQKIVAEYDYVTATGDKLYQVVRKEPGKKGRTKDFLQRRRVGNNWVWGLNGTQPVPYHLDELTQAKAKANGTPWRVDIVEGEKCVDRMRETWGVTATTNSGGAGSWLPQYNRHFPGADAVVIADNDNVGRQHAANVAAQLTGTAAEVTVIHLPGLGPKEDIFDWIGRGHSQAELEELIEEARKVPPPAPSPAWKDMLILTRQATVASIFANAIIALRNAPEWHGLLRFDEFHHHVVLCGTPPWGGGAVDRPWKELDICLAADWIQHQSINVGPEIVGRAAWTVAQAQTFHPVREYLESCRWDGVPRLDGWATTYLGVEPTWRDGPDGPIPGYVETVAARWLISAVARVMEPGCKADCALILEGPQDRKKSTALRTLADPWFTDDFSEFGSKDAAIECAGVWIIELAELDSINRTETSKIKSFMSRQVDRYRPPYALLPTSQSRQCVFAGTVNHEEYLKDETGGRRFWPLRCGLIDIEALARDRDQLWAEARDRYLAGERWYLSGDDSPELLQAARSEQQQRYLPDAWDGLITEYIQKHVITDISVAEILRDVIGLQQSDWKQPDQNRVARCLRNLGWVRRKPGTKNREWRYFKPDDAGEEVGVPPPEAAVMRPGTAQSCSCTDTAAEMAGAEAAVDGSPSSPLDADEPPARAPSSPNGANG